jgi:hypothetical protein
MSRISCTITTKIPNPSWKLLFFASPVTFRFTRSCQTFFVLQCSQQRTFQICNCVFLGELWLDMQNWWSRKSCTITTENSNSKLEIVVSCFTWYILFETLLANILCIATISTTFFRCFIEAFLVKLQKEMCSWLIRF